MLHKTFKIETKGQKSPAKLVTYVLDGSPEIVKNPKPLILICPGGGYEYTSDREAEGFAMKFNAEGFHAAVLRYSCAPAVYPTALKEAALAFALIRKNAKKWNVDPDRIVMQGSSAGGHLAFSYSVFYEEEFLLKETGLTKEEARPAGCMLCYPVITSGKYAHRGSFEALLGKNYAELKKDPMLKKMSLETQVKATTPPVFSWHTWTDDCVPVQNSLLLAEALRKHDVPMELHIFPEGGHGLGLCSEITQIPGGYGIQKECQVWIDLAITWVKGLKRGN
ncbi:MAG: alpha/beta hydrolase [Lachnospiraceae bacterium]|nr:alpha/beta hydrolase [Lachnospiraceae bacterium]